MTMPRTFALYLLATFLTRTALALAALGAVLTVFDTLAHINALLEGGAPVVPALLAYAGLRLPGLVVMVAPVAVLIGALLTLTALVRAQELVVARAAGISGLQIAAVLLVGAGLVAGAHGLFANLVAVDTAARLASWQARDFAGLPPEAGSDRRGLWLAADGAIVHVGAVTADGRELRDLLVIRRDAEGGFQGYLEAEAARFADGRWVLHGVARPRRPDGSAAATADPPVFHWPPSRFGNLGRDPAALSLSETLALAHYGTRGPRYYRFWTHRKLAQPASSLVMVLLAAPLAVQLARRRQLVLLGLATLAGGALYVGLERLLIPLGETAVLPPALAAWAPAVGFAALAVWRLIVAEA